MLYSDKHHLYTIRHFVHRCKTLSTQSAFTHTDTQYSFSWHGLSLYRVWRLIEWLCVDSIDSMNRQINSPGTAGHTGRPQTDRQQSKREGKVSAQKHIASVGYLFIEYKSDSLKMFYRNFSVTKTLYYQLYFFEIALIFWNSIFFSYFVAFVLYYYLFMLMLLYNIKLWVVKF